MHIFRTNRRRLVSRIFLSLIVIPTLVLVWCFINKFTHFVIPACQESKGKDSGQARMTKEDRKDSGQARMTKEDRKDSGQARMTISEPIPDKTGTRVGRIADKPQ